MSTATAKPLKMSDTALKFGPEWLRALSHGDSAVSPPPSPSLGAPRSYKLAEHRYGREEMLALFDKMMKVPNDLVVAPPLFVEKTQLPLALIQMTDEEMRMWQRGVNSDIVLKLMGRGTGPVAGNGVPPGAAASRGRGSSMDRGRGRGRGLGSVVGAYNRGTSYEDEGEHARRDGPPTGYGRGGRPFERTQSSIERVWVDRGDRNGAEEWNGSTSPRKEFGRPFSDNWRSREAARERERGETKEDDDGWRTAGRGERWAGRSGWRSERDGERDGDKVGDRFYTKGEREAWEASAGDRDRHRGWDEEGRPSGAALYANKRIVGRRAWEENDHLPEWAAEDLQGGGTFDASGAFRDERWSDEEDPEGDRKRVGSGEKLADDETEAAGASSSLDEASLADDERLQPAKISDADPVVVNSVTKQASVESLPSESGGFSAEVMDAAESPVGINGSPARSSSANLDDGRSPERLLPVNSNNVVDVDHNSRNDEDGLEHAQAVASTLVAQLVEDEDQPKEVPVPNHVSGMDQWFYRDPQGEVQGPFASAEMAEWFNSGYFTMALSVRRACDERFVQLGELTKMWGGRLPFLPGHHMPPLKLLNDSAVVNPMVAEQEKIHMIQQQLIQQQLFQQQMMQQQHMMVRQQSIVSKLSQMDGWNTLSSIQQQQIVNQHMMNIRPHAPTLVNSDPLLQQLRIQMEAQAKLQAEMLHRSKDPASALVMQHMQHQQQQQPPKSAPESVLVEGSMKQDPIQAFVQQLLGGQSKKPVAPPVPAKEMDPIQSLLQQAQWGVPPNQAPPGGSVMEQQQQHGAPGFHGMPPGPGLVPWPPHAMPIAVPSAVMYPSAVEPPTSVWDLEKAKIEENKRMLEQQQQLAEMRRREEEEKRMKEEEDRKRREMKEREEERRRHEELRREAEARQQAEAELRRRELERQQQLEEKRRRQEEEKMRKEEEMRQQQAEEERIRREEERIRREEERAAEQQRRQQEALLRLQEQQAAAQAQARLQQQQAAAAAAAAQEQQQLQQQQSQMKAQAAPWAQQQQNHQQQHSRGESLSLAEIQKLQEEKEMKDRAAEQAQKQEQAARAAALLQQQQQQAAIKLRWVKQNVSTAAPKSLAEIQAEEAAQLARQKEKERVEKATQPVNLNLAAAGAWGASSSSVASGASHSGSAWSSGRTAAAVVGQTANNSANSGWKAGSIGFWEDPSPRKAQSAAAPASKQTASKQQQAAASAAAAAAAANASGVQGKAAQASTESVSKKNRTNKEEETVRKLFGQTAEKKDSFSQWCFEYLKKVQAPIDVPTFVCFLKDVESPFEVQDYVRSYLGEGKEAKEFAKQFLEQRSRWRQLQRSVQQYEEDNMCIPAKAVNPGQASDFHEVKSKSKKSKKKMQKVDASLLGFSVSASTDRINVGERDFVDGM